MTAAVAIAFAGCLAKEQLANAQSEPSMKPFSMDHRRGALAQSPVDVSFLLDAPAGKHGFIQVKDGHLATDDGRRIRFWGVNITDWSKGSQQVPSKEDAVFLASTLARFGVNSVRFQFLDLDVPRGLLKKQRTDVEIFDVNALDREDYFIAELERRGIYIDFNLLVGRRFLAEEGVKDVDLLHQGSKGTSLYDAKMIELEKEYAKQLLTHRNPYTKHTYVEDPAVAIVEINNENAINTGFRAPSAFYRDELSRLYNQWLAKHRSAAERERLRQISEVAEEAAVPLMEGRTQVVQAPPERFYAEAEFYNDLQRDYFLDLKKYLRETLKSRSLIIATADHSHANSGYPILRATTGMDIIDGHTYWQHPESYVRKLPMVNDPENSTVVELSRSAIAGKPYTVSEVNNPFPNDYAGEGIPILAAYAGLQDWDAIYWYTFEPKSDPAWKPYVGDAFDISFDPLKMPELAAGALEFLRDDVAKAHTDRERSYSEQEVFDSMLIPATERPYYTDGFPLTFPLEHEVRISSLSGPPTGMFAKSVASNTIVSDTHELAWSLGEGHTNGLVTVNTPNSQALIGFVNEHGAVVLQNVSAETSNRFCTIWLSSMDALPIAKSARLLLVAGGRVENTGQRWNTARTDVTSMGGSPTLVEPVTGSLILRGLESARSVKIQAIDGAGQPLGAPVEVWSEQDTWKVPLGTVTTTWYEITVER